MINEIKKYATGMNAPADTHAWIDNVLSAHIKTNKPELTEVEHIIDYLCSDKRPKRISRMSYEQAKNNTDKWNAELIKKGAAIDERPDDVSVIKDFGDGFRIVRLVGENAYKREGFLMRHCVASYFGKGKEIYSLRDADNMPHCTMEKDQQIKGKGNGSIHPKYVGYIVAWLTEIGMEVGDSEMKNLGYVNIEKIIDKVDVEKSKIYAGKYLHESTTLYARDGEEYCDLDIWDYRPLLVADGEVSIKINFDLSVFIPRALRRIVANGDGGKSVANGDYGKSVANGNGGRSVANGYYGKSVANGDGGQSVANGDDGKSVANGDYGKSVANGYNGKSVANGYNGKSVANGNGGRSEVINGEDSIAAVIGKYGKVKASSGSLMVLIRYEDDRPVEAVSAVAGENGIKPDTWYRLNDAGDFEECES